MRILAVSDTHGYTSYLNQALARINGAVDMVIHLGDGENDYETIIKPLNIPSVFVRGNCDFGSSAPESQLVEVGDKKIFCTHGYKYAVKSGLSSLKSAARSHNADIVLFGHTHNALSDYEDGLYIVNPGSLSWRSPSPTFALIDIVSAGIMPNIVTF